MATDSDLQAMQTIVASSLQKVVGDLRKLQDQAKDAAGPSGGLGQLSTVFGGLTRQLAGPVGLAAGIYAVAQSLNSFAQGRLQIQNFSTDVGTSVRMIDAMTLSMNKAGISTEEAHGTIQKLGSSLKELASLGVGSKLDELLKNTRVSSEERKKLLEESRTDMDAAMKHLIEILNRGSSELQIYRANQLGILQSHIQGVKDYTQELDKTFRGGIESAKWWVGQWTDIGNIVTNTWDRMRESFTKFLSTIGGTKAIEETLKRVPKEGAGFNSKSLFGRAASALTGDTTPVEAFGQVGGAAASGLGSMIKNWLKSDAPLTGPLTSALTSMAPYALLNPLTAPLAGIHFLGRSGGLMGSAQAATNPTAAANLIRTEEDSNKSLRDIRDILQKWDVEDMSGRGGGGGDSSGGRGGIYSRSKIGRSERATGGPTFNERFTGQPDKSRSEFKDQGDSPVGLGAFDRSQFDEELKNNPGLFERMQTIVQGEVGHGAPTWKKRLALESIFNRAAARGQTLTQVTKQYTGPGSDGYYPSSTFSGGRIRSEDEFKRFQEQVMGPVRAGSDESTARLGFPATGNASAGVAARGAASGKYTRYGQIEPGAIPGQGGIETWVQEGNWGRGGRGAREDIGRLEATRRSDAARERGIMDGAATFNERFDPSMSATIDFKNMPSWVRTNVETNDKFKELKVTRGVPQDGKAGVVWGDTNKWSYE